MLAMSVCLSLQHRAAHQRSQQTVTLSSKAAAAWQHAGHAFWVTWHGQAVYVSDRCFNQM